MDRRTFIKAGVLVPLTVATSLSVACSPPPPSRAVPPVAAPVVGPPALVRSLGGQHALELLSDLVGRTESQVASPQIEEWLATRAEAERAAIRELNTGMAGKGFSDFRDPRVFANGDTIFYGVGNVDGRNACAPFWVNGKQAALVEGPAIVGLSLMAREWSSPAGVPAAQGLIPVGTIHRDQGAEFGISFPYPYVYKTTAGRVSINYQVGSTHPQGRISVVTERSDGTPLLSQRFELRDG
jgi:hypothetical protein